MSASIYILILSFFCNTLWAASYEVTVNPGDKLLIKGLAAQVQLNGGIGPNLRISGVETSSSEGEYVVTKRENVIEVRMIEFSGKKDWVKASPQIRKIEITGLPIPTEVHLRSGSINAQKWVKDLKVNMAQGKVIVANGEGLAQVYLHKGETQIIDHKGKINADGYSGLMSLKNIQGDIELSLFSGNLQLEKIFGFISVSAQQANSKIQQSTGTVQFENGKGNFQVMGLQGRIEGSNQEGNITVQMALDSELDIKAKSGKVTVQSAAASGASVNLFTMDGDIYVPSELKVMRTSSEKSVRGRLRGETARGSILVRGQEATILLK